MQNLNNEINLIKQDATKKGVASSSVADGAPSTEQPEALVRLYISNVHMFYHVGWIFPTTGTISIH